MNRSESLRKEIETDDARCCWYWWHSNIRPTQANIPCIAQFTGVTCFPILKSRRPRVGNNFSTRSRISCVNVSFKKISAYDGNLYRLWRRSRSHKYSHWNLISRFPRKLLCRGKYCLQITSTDVERCACRLKYHAKLHASICYLSGLGRNTLRMILRGNFFSLLWASKKFSFLIEISPSHRRKKELGQRFLFEWWCGRNT